MTIARQQGDIFIQTLGKSQGTHEVKNNIFLYYISAPRIDNLNCSAGEGPTAITYATVSFRAKVGSKICHFYSGSSIALGTVNYIGGSLSDDVDSHASAVLEVFLKPVRDLECRPRFDGIGSRSIRRLQAVDELTDRMKHVQ